MSDFLAKYSGFLGGILKWEDLSVLWERIRSQGDAVWYVYHVGDPVPGAPLDRGQLDSFIESIERTYPFYMVRLLGGVLFLLGMFIMAYNMWKTIAEAKPADDAIPQTA